MSGVNGGDSEWETCMKGAERGQRMGGTDMATMSLCQKIFSEERGQNGSPMVEREGGREGERGGRELSHQLSDQAMKTDGKVSDQRYRCSSNLLRCFTDLAPKGHLLPPL